TRGFVIRMEAHLEQSKVRWESGGRTALELQPHRSFERVVFADEDDSPLRASDQDPVLLDLVVAADRRPEDGDVDLPVGMEFIRGQARLILVRALQAAAAGCEQPAHQQRECDSSFRHNSPVLFAAPWCADENLRPLNGFRIDRNRWLAALTAS